MQEGNIQKSFCTTREAAKLLGMSVGTVQLWVESGLLEAWKTTGGHRRVLRESVDRLLRKKPGAEQVQLPVDAIASAVRPMSVLVVDDDVNALRLYEANISRWPMKPHIVVADNAISALLIMGATCPDLLITDLRMPETDGFSMLRVLLKTPALAKTTIVVVSGLDATEIAQRGGIPAGIAILPKPIPFDRLLGIATRIDLQNRFKTSLQ